MKYRTIAYVDGDRISMTNYKSQRMTSSFSSIMSPFAYLVMYIHVKRY